MESQPLSLAARLAALPREVREELLATLTEDQRQALMWDWKVWARPNQLPPPEPWDIWLIDTGRGWGKTRTGAEWIRAQARKFPRLHLVGRTAGDVRDVMIEGESGILAISPPDFRPLYEPSKRRLTWPNGAIATTFASAEPDELRGPQCHAAWADEPATWIYAKETWDNLMLGLRLGKHPQCVATTTPKNVPIILELLADAASYPDVPRRVVVTKGTTYENIENLAPSFINHIVRRYEGTKLGRQELYAELLVDDPNALWRRGDPNTPGTLEGTRVRKAPVEMRRVVVGVDPSGSSGEDAAECGIVVAGLGEDGDAYVLADRSRRDTPAGWGHAVVTVADDYLANEIIAEKNFGGAMVEQVIRTMAQPGHPLPKVTLVTSSRGKYLRAEPVAALYEQGRVHHVGYHAQLEDQMVSWVPGERSPDRLDAIVFAITAIMEVTGLRYGLDYGIEAIKVGRIGR